ASERDWWIGVMLSGENRRQLWIPAEFAYGFQVITPQAEWLRKSVIDRDPDQQEAALRWHDPAFAAGWPWRVGVGERAPHPSERTPEDA
ncbi:MAG: dTDP-4-dehydrorhamnose 3,5-epimerase family protein, partial [Magnetococcales bacterium]|nr:dTDP-4-dehydrorhamnose 3,5-epimerase family protein [Magnetococcales bacterium]